MEMRALVAASVSDTSDAMHAPGDPNSIQTTGVVDTETAVGCKLVVLDAPKYTAVLVDMASTEHMHCASSTAPAAAVAPCSVPGDWRMIPREYDERSLDLQTVPYERGSRAAGKRPQKTPVLVVTDPVPLSFRGWVKVPCTFFDKYNHTHEPNPTVNRGHPAVSPGTETPATTHKQAKDPTGT